MSAFLNRWLTRLAYEADVDGERRILALRAWTLKSGSLLRSRAGLKRATSPGEPFSKSARHSQALAPGGVVWLGASDGMTVTCRGGATVFGKRCKSTARVHNGIVGEGLVESSLRVNLARKPTCWCRSFPRREKCSASVSLFSGPRKPAQHIVALTGFTLPPLCLDALIAIGDWLSAK